MPYRPGRGASSARTPSPARCASSSWLRPDASLYRRSSTPKLPAPKTRSSLKRPPSAGSVAAKPPAWQSGRNGRTLPIKVPEIVPVKVPGSFPARVAGYALQDGHDLTARASTGRRLYQEIGVRPA
jgi:hypothetical protein